MKYRVYLIDNNGDGHVQELPDWDGDDPLEIRLATFARDATISIEPDYESQDDE